VGKYRFLSLIALAALLALVPGTIARAEPDYIRLHIIAASDSDFDQAVKLCVRDEVREVSAALLEDCQSADEAFERLNVVSEELRMAAEARARREGFEGSVRIELGVFPFPDRMYGEELVPAGAYRAVRIVLGEGEGQNWWCVVYPGLCLPEDNHGELIVFYSSIGAWIRRVFGGGGETE